MVTALIAAGILIAAQYIPNTLVPFAVLQFCVGLGFSGIFPSANAMIINLTSPLERGSAFGMLFSSQQIGGAIGPLIGGLIATYVNLASVFFVSGCTLVFIAILVILKAPASLKINPQLAAKETPSHDAISAIKEEAAKEIEQEMAAQAKAQAQEQKLQQDAHDKDPVLSSNASNK